MRLRRFFLHLCWVVPVLIIATYAWNPSGVPSWDPRARLLGFIPYRVPSESMVPTMVPGAMFVACTGAEIRAQPAIGDIVVFLPPPPEEQSAYVKRIVAVGGDSVLFEGGRFSRNGVVQIEKFVVPGTDQEGRFEAKVPKGFVFVAGDNRAHSLDSRHFGPIAASSIIGKACLH